MRYRNEDGTYSDVEAVDAAARTNPYKNKIVNSPARVLQDIETIKELVKKLDASTQRIFRIAHAMGYDQRPKETSAPGQGTVEAISLNMGQVLDQLRDAVDANAHALNLFD